MAVRYQWMRWMAPRIKFKLKEGSSSILPKMVTSKTVLHVTTGKLSPTKSFKCFLKLYTRRLQEVGILGRAEWIFYDCD